MRNLIVFVSHLIAAVLAFALGVGTLLMGQAANNGALCAIATLIAFVLIVLSILPLMLRIKDLRIAVSYGV